MIICKYSEEFINEVKECYPELTGLHELAETGNGLLGSQLLELIGGTPLDFILNAQTLEEVKEWAAVAKRKHDLYVLWCKEIGSDRWRQYDTPIKVK